MKRSLVITTRWVMPSILAFMFLILPNLVQNDMAHPAWIVRIFSVVFLSNSFFGAANVLNNPTTVKEGVDKYRTSDKDTLIFSYVVGHSLFIISAIFLFCYGLANFYPLVGWWKYLSSVVYGMLISVIHYSICKMQIHQIREDEMARRT